MAYLYRGNSVLTRESIGSNILRFTNNVQDANLVATVGLYQVTTVSNSNGIVSNMQTPSTSVCPGVRYYLRISFPDWDQNSPCFLTANAVTNTYTCCCDISMYTTFITLSATRGPVIASRQFQGTMMIPGRTNVSDTFSLQNSPYFSKVGYVSALPMLLSNCKVCNCPSGSRCNDQGICVNSTTTPCRTNSLCGANGGRCFGRCAGGFLCSNVSGRYSCVKPKETIPWWMILIWILLAIVLSLMIAFLFYYLLNPPFEKSAKLTPAQQAQLNAQVNPYGDKTSALPPPYAQLQTQTTQVNYSFV